jgi:hypothetical protein
MNPIAFLSAPAVQSARSISAAPITLFAFGAVFAEIFLNPNPVSYQLC